MSEPGISRWAILAGVVGAAFLFRHYSRSGSASGTGTGNAKSTSVSAKPAPPPSIKRTVKSLSIFPVKSCKGIDVDEARCEDIGFALDRYWVVVCPETAGEDGKEPEHPVKINTLRESPSMALIGTALEFDDKKLKAGTGLYKDGGTLVLSAPGMEDCRVRFPRKAKEGEKPWTCFMFFNVNQLLDEGDEVASWLSKYLGKECRLAVQDTTFVRPTLDRWTPAADFFQTSPTHPDAYTPQTSNSDAFPYLVISTASLAAVKSFIDADIKAKQGELEKMDPPPPESATDANELSGKHNYADRRRFRANIIVENGEDPAVAFEEDDFKRSKIGSVEFESGMLCTRCTVPSADPDTGKQTKQPLISLQKHRRHRMTMDMFKFKACLGCYMFSQTRGGSVKVGDAVEVLEVGPTMDAKPLSEK